jgi:hypothetical protein
MHPAEAFIADPAAARKAEGRARELLRSAAGETALAMYQELGFVAVAGRDPRYGFLIYAQRPIVSFDADAGEPLSEHCVRFQEGGARSGTLPDADDVLAKWLAVSADERRVLADANLDPPGRQLDPAQVRRDLRKLALWRGRRSQAEGVTG